MEYIYFLIIVLKVLYIFWTKVPYQIYDVQIFSPSLWLIFLFS